MHGATVLAAAGKIDGIRLFIPGLPEIFWSLVAIIVIALVLRKLVLPPLNKMLATRHDTIEGGIARAGKAQQEAAEVRAKNESEVEEAREEAGRIRQSAREDGATIVAEARERAQSEADRIVAHSKAQIEAERTQALGSLRSEVGSIAANLASKIVGESLQDDARSSRVIDRFLDELEKAEADDASSENAQTPTASRGSDGAEERGH